MAETSDTAGFDRHAAVTRSLLGYGVLAGVFYLVVGLILALTRDGFDVTRYPLSLLMLGEDGWMQRANLMVTGAMVLIASWGFSRAMREESPATRIPALLAVFGGTLIASGIFPPDPMIGFPPGTDSTEASLSGILHMAFGAVGFGCLAAAALSAARWFSARGQSGLATYSRISAGIVVAGFVAGAALSSGGAGVLALWAAVVGGLSWLAVTSISVYRTVPHPDAHRRTATSSYGLPC